jgi:hypothetical protein
LDSSANADILSDAEITRLAAAAVAAPSADNSQPWTLARRPEGIVIGLRPDATPLFFDCGGWAGEISLGAAAENVVQTAPGLGLTAEMVPLSSGREPRVLLRMQRQPDATPSPYEHAVLARHTNRGRYSERPIGEATANLLVRALDGFPTFQLRWALTSSSRSSLIRAAEEADRVRYTHARIHRDFHESLRFGTDNERYRDGLADDTLGIESFLVPVLRLLKPWPVARAANALGLHQVMVWRGTRLPLTQAPLLGVLTCSAEADGVTCGRMLERVWLAAETAGLAFQPFGALPLLLRRMGRGEGEGLGRSHQVRLRNADIAWRRAVGAAAETLVMIIRVGYATGAVHRARRRPVESFMA